MKQNSGIVLDILRGAFNDGPGIRTTVFLKGCPLNCSWCHNPESQSGKIQWKGRDSNLNVIRRKLKTYQPELNINQKREILGAVHNGCAEKFEFWGRNYRVEEVMEIVLKDLEYYEKEGGLTLSGGEPMFQPQFAVTLLQEAKRHGIHTAVDTSGYADLRVLKQFIPWTDLWLFDWKISDPMTFKQYTGGNLEVVERNLSFLYAAGADVVLRCPVIPGVNDNQQHFEFICQLFAKMPRIKGPHLMPFHDHWLDKKAELGDSHEAVDQWKGKMAAPEKWVDYLKQCGCQDAIMVE